MLRIVPLFLLFAGFAMAQVTVESPALVQCESATISWSGGSGPYNVYIYPEFYLDPSSFLEQLGPVDGTSVQWLANLPSGDRVRVNVRDATNPGFEDSAFSDVATIGSGSDDSCLASGPLGTGGLPDVPTGTNLPDFPSASLDLPSIQPFDPSSTGRLSSGSGSVSTSSAARSSSASASSASSSAASASVTGPVNGGEGPGGSDSGNGAYPVTGLGWTVAAPVVALLGVVL